MSIGEWGNLAYTGILAAAPWAALVLAGVAGTLFAMPLVFHRSVPWGWILCFITLAVGVGALACGILEPWTPPQLFAFA